MSPVGLLLIAVGVVLEAISPGEANWIALHWLGLALIILGAVEVVWTRLR